MKKSESEGNVPNSKFNVKQTKVYSKYSYNNKRMHGKYVIRFLYLN